MLRVEKKIKKNRTRDRTNSAAPLSLTLYVEVSLVMLATLDATARADVVLTLATTPPLASFFGFRSLSLIFVFFFLSLACLLFILRRVVC